MSTRTTLNIEMSIRYRIFSKVCPKNGTIEKILILSYTFCDPWVLLIIDFIDFRLWLELNYVTTIYV